MASAAAIGGIQGARFSSSSSESRRKSGGVVPRNLLFACSSLSGQKIVVSKSKHSSCRKQYGGRTLFIVSPIAASDSKNSQTCLDPDASRSVLGIILGGGAGTRLYQLTKKRAKPAVP